MKNLLSKVLVPNLNNLFIWLNAGVMLYGVFYLGWKSEVVIIAYFLETIIIGFIHVCKMLLVYFFSSRQQFDLPTSKNTLTGFVAIPFFIFHYFFFIFVQSIFIFTILKNMIPAENSTFNVFGNYAYLLSQHNILIAFLTLAFSNVALTFKNFIFPGTYKTTTVSELFFQPYLRIFIQQFVTILAMFFSALTSGSIAAALMIIIFRFITDLFIVTASNDVSFKQQLISRLKKGQKPEDATQTEESVNSFLQK